MLKISVVTVCYNASATIEQTIRSVLNQSYRPIEYIVIDGGSTDGTVDIIKKYANRLAYWISEPDRGIYDAMNKGIAAATGDYINFMNCGDTFASSDALKEFVPRIDSDTDVVYGYCKIYIGNHSAISKPLPMNRIKTKLPFCHQSCFVRTTFHKEHPFDTSFKILADYNLFYGAYYQSQVKFQYIPVLVANYDVGTASASNANYTLAVRERYRIWGIVHNPIKKIPFELQLIYLRISYAVRCLLPDGIVMRIKALLAAFRPHS